VVANRRPKTKPLRAASVSAPWWDAQQAIGRFCGSKTPLKFLIGRHGNAHNFNHRWQRGLGLALARSFLMNPGRTVVWLGLNTNREKARLAWRRNFRSVRCVKHRRHEHHRWRGRPGRNTARDKRLDVLVNKKAITRKDCSHPATRTANGHSHQSDGVFHGCQPDDP